MTRQKFDSAYMARLGRIGGYVTHSRHDPRETTKNGRAAFLKRFEDQVDPDRTLTEAERLRRAEAAREAHFARMALASVRARGFRSQPKHVHRVEHCLVCGEELDCPCRTRRRARKYCSDEHRRRGYYEAWIERRARLLQQTS